MDHALDSLQPFYDAALQQFMDAQKEDNYKKFSDNPFYFEVTALIKSMNILREYMGWEKISLKKELDFYLN